MQLEKVRVEQKKRNQFKMQQNQVQRPIRLECESLEEARNQDQSVIPAMTPSKHKRIKFVT